MINGRHDVGNSVKHANRELLLGIAIMVLDNCNIGARYFNDTDSRVPLPDYKVQDPPRFLYANIKTCAISANQWTMASAKPVNPLR